MKTLTLLIFILFGIIIIPAQTLTVTVDNVLNEKGKILVALHTPDTFMKGPGILNAEKNIKGKTIEFTFDDVKPGTYAIMVLHDENENSRMDYEPNGMPREAYGMSNNPISYGPPQFGEAKFEMGSEDKQVIIRF